MTKKITALCSAFILALLASIPTTALVSANTSWCQTATPPWETPGAGNVFAGNTLTSPSYQFDYVRADINTSNATDGFQICGPTPTDFDLNGALAWVAITPGSGSEHYNQFNAILQIGITRCADIGQDACDGAGADPQFFWARGGCGSDPDPEVLSINEPGDWSSHKYEIYKSGSTYFLEVDDIVKASIQTNNENISCWIGEDNQLELMGERWDRGDSLGNTSSHTTFRNIRYSYSNSPSPSTIQATTWTTGVGCYEEIAEDWCHRSWPDGFDIWTSQ